jgi:outer membrane protein assembly factor BamB
MPKGSRTLPLFVVILLITPAVAGNWTRFRGPNGTGVAEDTDIPVQFSDKNILWKAPIPGDGNSSPVVWGNHIFLQTSLDRGKERALLCLDADTGKILWTRNIPGKFVKLPMPGSSLASSTPATDGEAVFISFWDGQDIILKAFTFKGEEIWSRNFGEFVSQHGPAASPIVYKDRLFLANDMDGKSTLYALNKRTGETIWEMPREGFRTCYSVPFLLDRPGVATELVVTSTTGITGYNPDSGKKNWEWHWKWSSKRPLRTVASPVVHEGMLFACSGDGGGDRHMVALRLPEGTNGKATQLWENKKTFPYVPCPLARGEHLYIINDKGLAGCFHAKTGKQVWFERLPDSSFSSSPLLVGDKMYAVSDQGDVYVFAAEPTYQLLAKNPLGERSRGATPAVANNRLYVRGQHHLFCIGKT